MTNGFKKTEVYLLWGIVIAAGIYFLLSLSDILDAVRRKHPDLGLIGWALTVLWFFGGMLVGVIATKYCHRKNWSRSCYVEGWAASALYLFLSFVIYVFALDT